MKYLLVTAFASLLASSAFAADISKAEQTAQFRVKVATCKADAKAHGVQTASSAFYSYMGACVDRVSVAVAIEPAK